jgi:hypothetical protein
VLLPKIRLSVSAGITKIVLRSWSQSLFALALLLLLPDRSVISMAYLLRSNVLPSAQRVCVKSVLPTSLRRHYYIHPRGKTSSSHGSVFGRIGALRPVHADISAKYFDYKQVEEKMYKWWDETGHMKPTDAATVAEGFIHTNNSNSKNESFCIPMPPPNVTGSLHIGFVYSVILFLCFLVALNCSLCIQTCPWTCNPGSAYTVQQDERKVHCVDPWDVSSH